MTGTKRRKSYASRTCRACRESKQRCSLPKSSLLELPSVHGVSPCGRCRKLGSVCILDDFSKRSKIEYMRRCEESRLDVETRQEETMGSRLLLLELIRQVRINGVAEPHAARSKAASMEDLDRLLGDDMCEELSSWSYNELRLWFPSLKPAHHLHQLRRHTSRPSPARTIQETVQYLIAAFHRPALLDGEAERVIELAESLIKASLAELMLASSHSPDALLALQLVSFFQIPGSLSLPLLSASTKAARLAMLSSSSNAVNKLAWCSAAVWESCIALGTQPGLELFRPDECPSMAFVEELSASIDQGDVSVRAILLRARNLAHLCEAWRGVSCPASLDVTLARWNTVTAGALRRVEELDPLQRAFVRLEVDIANTLIHGKALAAALGEDLLLKLAFLAHREEMRAFINQRRHLVDLLLREERQPMSLDAYKVAAEALISVLFAADASTAAVLTTTGTNATPLPTLYGVGYLYEAVSSLLRSGAPFLHSISRERYGLSMQSVKRLLQSVLAAKPGHALLGTLCAQVELDFILEDPILST